MNKLYLVATPIGNLEDISARALKVLQTVSLIAAEDTRHTLKLLNHYHIKNRLISLYDHNEEIRIPYLLEILQGGDVALVSDGGTPALNDPGYALVNAVITAGFQVIPIPGPCAPITALIASGLPTNQFLYLGFLPRQRNARLKSLQEILHHPYTLIFLEAPHRLISALEDMLTILGNRHITVARELTKIHEEFYRGTISDTLTHYKQTIPRGEITLIVEGAPQTIASWDDEKINGVIIQNLKSGKTTKQIIQELLSQTGLTKKQLYQRIQQLSTQSDPFTE
ncbi:MAG: 16S rRNA (cytidine(1402)-2'-O)-methyltransferase [Anaerolineales bacterium]